MNQFFTRNFLQFFTLAIVFVGCENNMKDVMAINKKVTQVEEGKNINSIYTTAGKIKANLKASLMLRYMTDSPYLNFHKAYM